jgi:hypothetical protein
VGSRVRGQAILLAVSDISGRIQLVTRMTIEREGSDEPVCIAESVDLIFG